MLPRHDPGHVHGPWRGPVLARGHAAAPAAGEPHPVLEVLPCAPQAAPGGTPQRVR